ncbi:MAG: hypothetical protein PHT44_03945 [Candidatus Portnoybacteria bacterium]|nr:hypothetical protein [Candidatus Portnoybacteria bacterium]MDD4983022.1 hypothetical protein [Candidatus Portnoybacteria bacterium]
MLGAESQKQAFESLPSPEPKEGELSEGEQKKGPAKIYPFPKPGEQKKPEAPEEGFCGQDMKLISNGEVIAEFHRGFPTKIIPKGEGRYEILEKKPMGKVVSSIFEKVEEIEIG